jgi:tetratricopeptide (TPR) repeat protein
MFVYLDEFIQKHPQNTYPLILKSQLYSIGSEWNNALAVLDKGMQQWPEVPQFYEEMARVYTKKNELEKAKESYKKGLEKIPDNVRLRVYLASLYEAEKDYDNAMQHYEALIDKRPDVDIAINNLVSLLLDHYPTKENIKRAADLSKRFETSDKAYYQDTYGWALLHNGKLKKAVTIFKTLVRKNPEIAVFKYHLGLGYYKTNKNEKALKELEQALETGAKQKQFIEKEQIETLLEEIKAIVENAENA